MNEVLKAQGLGKTFNEGTALALSVFDNLDFAVQQGERIAIVGASGSGKSTLLHLLGGLDRVSRGTVWAGGLALSGLNDGARSDLRNRHFGFIYQFHHLLPEFTALENVAMPLRIRRVPKIEAEAQAAHLLAQVGLGQRLHHKPGELSGGERQRAAVARALVTQPACILADEPTGNLDVNTAETVFNLMLDLNQQHRTALVMVTHDPRLAARMDAVYRLHGGKLAREAS
jgi:lipoprotein-releasing system ATP-binding protein